MGLFDKIYVEIKKEGVDKMRDKLVKGIQKLIRLIIRANDKELDAIGIKLADIEKDLLNYKENQNKIWHKN